MCLGPSFLGQLLLITPSPSPSSTCLFVAPPSHLLTSAWAPVGPPLPLASQSPSIHPSGCSPFSTHPQVVGLMTACGTCLPPPQHLAWPLWLFGRFYDCFAEKEMATHSSVLAWRIPGMGEHGGLPSMGLHGVGHD